MLSTLSASDLALKVTLVKKLSVVTKNTAENVKARHICLWISQKYFLIHFQIIKNWELFHIKRYGVIIRWLIVYAYKWTLFYTISIKYQLPVDLFPSQKCNFLDTNRGSLTFHIRINKNVILVYYTTWKDIRTQNDNIS